MEFSSSWGVHFSLVEFVYNNSYHFCIQMASYDVLYSRKCRSLLCWAEVGDQEPLEPDIILKTMEKVRQK